jgi:hypothetical protein
VATFVDHHLLRGCIALNALSPSCTQRGAMTNNAHNFVNRMVSPDLIYRKRIFTRKKRLSVD